MAKMMGLDYIIQYKKGKDSVVADALSRCQEQGEVAALTTLIPEWYQEVASNYNLDD